MESNSSSEELHECVETSIAFLRHHGSSPVVLALTGEALAALLM